MWKLTALPDLAVFVQARLDEHWSPEQIANCLPKLLPQSDEMRVTHETIYQAIYVKTRSPLRRGAGVLRGRRTLRKVRRRPDCRLSRFARPMVMINSRPGDVADRVVAGHWEGDLITGTENRSAIGTLVEHTTRYTVLLHLPDGSARHGGNVLRLP